jgi:hypothetical protein
MGIGSATGRDTSACPGSNFAGKEFTSRVCQKGSKRELSICFEGTPAGPLGSLFERGLRGDDADCDGDVDIYLSNE